MTDLLLNLQNGSFLSNSILICLIIWEMTWKLIAMWKAGRNNQLAWFIFIAVLNTVGILPIVYLLIQRKKN